MRKVFLIVSLDGVERVCENKAVAQRTLELTHENVPFQWDIDKTTMTVEGGNIYTIRSADLWTVADHL